jgi:hypothetical protein
MRNDPSRPHGPAWRQQPGAGGRNPKAQQDWRKDAPPPSIKTRVWSRKTKVRVGIATLGALLAALVGIILWYLPARPPSLFLFANGYQTNLAIPPNVYGVKLVDQLDKWAQSSPDNLWGRELPDPKERPKSLSKDKANDWFKDVDRIRFKEKTVVLFFALHGGADQKGPYLLYNDAEPRDGEDGRLRIEAVLERLKDLPPAKNKVVILDATQVPADWEFGMMHNDFARKLEELNDKIQAIDNCIVLSASDVDQRSWTSVVLEAPVFSYYLLQGLQGAVDPNHTSAINALDLFHYVQKKVSEWAHANRAAEQTPVLLPKGKEGEERASRIITTQVPRAYSPPPAPKERSEGWTADLEQQWREFARLQNRVPSPAVYHPQLWQYYQALMLRYEELVRADDQASANQLKTTELERVANQLAQNPFDDFTCLNNAIPLRAAFGLTLTTAQRRDLEDQLSLLWESQGARWADVRKWARDKHFPGGEARLRVEACDWLLERLTQGNNPPTREQVLNVLKAVAGEPDARPAEAHYLYMAVQHLPKDQGIKYLQEALRTRRLAEQAALAVAPDSKASSEVYPYSERVWDCIKDRVAAGDRQRRWGEDMLFASDPGRWDLASKRFQTAQEAYKGAIGDAQVVSQALHTRDQAMALLPAYSRWLAERRVFGSNRDAINLAMDELEGLWVKVQRLSDRLEVAGPNGIQTPLQTDAEKTRNQEARSLKQLTDELRKGLDDFRRTRFDSVANASLTEVVQTNWYEIEALLHVPWIDPERRKELLTASQRISFSHYSKFLNAQQTGQVDRIDSLEAAQNQARMALAVLGKDWVDKQPRNSDFPYQELQAKIRRRDEKTWRVDFLAYGEQIGRCWNQIPEQINRQAKDAHLAGTKVADVLDHLNRAEQLCRRIDGAAVPWVQGSPAEESQRLRLAHWLTALADRTVADQWFSGPGQRPFYQIAADRFRESAQALLKGWDAQQNKLLFADVDRLKDAIRNPVEFRVVGNAPANVTSEKQVDCTFTVEGKGLQPGFPVLELEVPAEQAFLTPTGAVKPAEWVTQAIGGDETIQPPVYAFARNEKAPANPRRVEKIDLTVKAFYRGQEASKTATIQGYPQPDTIVTQYPKPKSGKVAVRTDRSIEERFAPKNGVISIILDCSGSMWAGSKYDTKVLFNQGGEALIREKNVEEAKAGRRRFDKAVKALEEVLGELSDGYHVNLWIFGQSDESEGKIKKLWNIPSWDGQNLHRLMRDIRAITPYGTTPLARALRDVRKKDFADKKEGFQTIVVLTDGHDEDFDKDPQLNPTGKLTIPEFLTPIFDKSGIQVHMVLFDVLPNEAKGAREQFGMIASWDPPGKLYPNTRDVEQLKENLRKAFHPELRFWLYDLKTNQPVAKAGLPVTPAATKNPLWSGSLAKGSYKAKVHDFLGQNILTDPGDFLILNILWADRYPYLRRALFADEYKQFTDYQPEIKQKKQWQLSVLENYPDDIHQNTLKLKAALEQLDTLKSGESPALIQQSWPGFTWFEVKAADGAPPLFHWSNLEGYPAPLWSLDLIGWPGLNTKPAKPILSAWWTDTNVPITRYHLTSPLHHDPRIPLEQDFQEAKKATLQRDGFTLQSVAIEKQEIDGQMPSCLVVRIRYPKGQPVLAIPNFGVREGARHCYYQDADQYTGIFWTVGRGDIKEDFELEIVSLKKFQEAAEKEGHFSGAWELKPPDKSYQWNTTWKATDEADLQ